MPWNGAMTGWVAAGVLAALIGLFGLGYWRGGAAAREHCQLEAAQEALELAAQQRKLQAAADAAAAGYERQKAAQAAAVRELQKELKDAIAANAVYRDCRVPADGVRLYNRAAAGEGAAGR
jgi:hypothetical protein